MFNLQKVVLFIFCLLLSVSIHAAEITVFAAASLTDALKAVAANYDKISSDQIAYNFAASGVLERQIEAGAPADIFFSADETQMDKLAAKELLVDGSRHDLLGNSLVIVTAPDNTSVQSATDLTNAAVHRIALGDAKSVPAGAYAKTYLDGIGIWTAIEPKVAPCENVRAVLGFVESGNADAGIVYKTDAAISKKVKVAYEIPSADGPKINYPVALTKDAPQADAAKKFLDYLGSDESIEVFRKYGFTIAGK